MAYLKIEWLERKHIDSLNKDVLEVSVSEEGGKAFDATIWQFDKDGKEFPNFSNLRAGDSINASIWAKNGKTTLYPPKPVKSSPGAFLRPTGSVKTETVRAENIKQAQQRKAESIAYFNSVNSAISMLNQKEYINQLMTIDERQREIVKWRDWFISEFEKWDNDNGVPFP